MALTYVSPLAFYQGYSERKFRMAKLLKPKNLFFIILAGASLGGWTYSITVAAEITLISHTTLLSNCGSLFLIGWAAIKGKKLNKFEIIGCLIALGGCTISVTDGSHGGAEGRGVTMTGDLLATLGSLFSAIFMLASEQIDSSIPSLVLTSAIQLATLIT